MLSSLRFGVRNIIQNSNLTIPVLEPLRTSAFYGSFDPSTIRVPPSMRHSEIVFHLFFRIFPREVLIDLRESFSSLPTMALPYLFALIRPIIHTLFDPLLWLSFPETYFIGAIRSAIVISISFISLSPRQIFSNFSQNVRNIIETATNRIGNSYNQNRNVIERRAWYTRLFLSLWGYTTGAGMLSLLVFVIRNRTYIGTGISAVYGFISTRTGAGSSFPAVPFISSPNNQETVMGSFDFRLFNNMFNVEDFYEALRLFFY